MEAKHREGDEKKGGRLHARILQLAQPGVSMVRLYRRLCAKWGPRGLTLSGWAWVYAQETGCVWFRNRIDGFFLLFFGQANHSQASYQRCTRANRES